MSKRARIVVIGAGVVGLSTAVKLQDTLGDRCHVTIIADKFFEETTSYGAAGIVRPPIERMPGVPEPIVRKWISEGMKHYSSLAMGPEAEKAGMVITSGYMFFNQRKERPIFADYIYEFHECSDKELNMYPGRRFKYGWHVATVIVECRRYLPFLMEKFKRNGGVVIHRKVNSFDELCHYDMIVNCSGFGSRQLQNDDKMFAVRGHLIRVKAPWLKTFVHTDWQYHVYPVRDGVVLGGVRQDDNWDLTPRPEDREHILSKVYEVVPSLRNAEILEEWVGLRPCRSALRVDRERKLLGAEWKPMWIVNNYGQGPLGVAVSWGCAVSACELVQEILTADSRSKL